MIVGSANRRSTRAGSARFHSGKSNGADVTAGCARVKSLTFTASSMRRPGPLLDLHK